MWSFRNSKKRQESLPQQSRKEIEEKKTKWERLEMSSRKLEIPREHFMQRWDRSGMDLTEAEDIKKRWQEYTEELYKKYLHDPDNHDGLTYLEPDINGM